MPKTKEQCEAIRKQTKDKIINEALLYFAKNGFDGFKIGDFSKSIGIGQGTMYQYFKSKEELYNEIKEIVNSTNDIEGLRNLAHLPILPSMKMTQLSKYIIDKLNTDKMFAATITLNTQIMLNEGEDIKDSLLYTLTTKIIHDGQIMRQFKNVEASHLADLYWSMVYVYALKMQFLNSSNLLTAEDLYNVVGR